MSEDAGPGQPLENGGRLGGSAVSGRRLPRGEGVPERLLLSGEPGASQVCAPPVCRLIGLLCSEMRGRVRRVPRVV